MNIITIQRLLTIIIVATVGIFIHGNMQSYQVDQSTSTTLACMNEKCYTTTPDNSDNQTSTTISCINGSCYKATQDYPNDQSRYNQNQPSILGSLFD